MAAEQVHFVSAHPDSTEFVWETHVFIQNFLQLGIAPRSITSLFAVDPATEPSPALQKLQAQFPQVDIRVMDDRRDEDGRAYVPSIQPHLIERWLRETPEREFMPTFFHDSDIALRRVPDFDAIFREHPGDCVLSDTISYIGYRYLHGCCEKIRRDAPSVPEDELIAEMCAVVGIDIDVVKRNEPSSGGAQYLYTGVGADYWGKVYRDSIALRKLFDDYFVDLKLPQPPDEYLQIWTAGMWSYLWNLWAGGHQTVLHDEMTFLWARDDRSKEGPIMHMTGVHNDVRGLHFNKRDWAHVSPIDAVRDHPWIFDQLSSRSVSTEYVALIHDAAGVSRPTPTPMHFEEATHWRVATWKAGPGGQMWDVQNLSLSFDRDTTIVDHMCSGDAGPGYEASQAFDPGPSFWGGRRSEDENEPPVFFLGVQLDKPARPERVVLTQALSARTAQLALLQYSHNGTSWTTAKTIPMNPDRARHNLLHTSDQGLTASAWRIGAKATSSDFAWDVTRVRLLANETEESGVPSSSGQAGDDLSIGNAFRDDDEQWGGRADEDGFHILLSDTSGLPVNRIILDQGVDHWASEVDIEALDAAGTWQRVTTCAGLIPGINDLLLFDDVLATRRRVPAAVTSDFGPFADRRILVLLSSEGGAEVAQTVANAINQAAYPEHLRFAICHLVDDETEAALAEWADDARFTIESVPVTESPDVEWLQTRPFALFDDEPYMLQVDAHSRFAARWDVRYVEMLESTEAESPLLTAEPLGFTVDDAGEVVYELGGGTEGLTRLHDVVCARQVFARGQRCRDISAGRAAAPEDTSDDHVIHAPTENLVWCGRSRDMAGAMS